MKSKVVFIVLKTVSSGLSQLNGRFRCNSKNAPPSVSFTKIDVTVNLSLTFSPNKFKNILSKNLF
ncbi:MAG: hypothetical protein HC817_05490 [Saprospiraceae bacterium]|nr:hypothetical protein [Saprospiraceae bacterium]